MDDLRDGSVQLLAGFREVTARSRTQQRIAVLWRFAFIPFVLSRCHHLPIWFNQLDRRIDL